MTKWFLVLNILFFISCSKNTFHKDKIFAGSVIATQQELNSGKRIYMEYCMACHGPQGDGKGVASKGMSNPPRDFTTGIFKFGKVVSGELLHDSTLVEIIRKGLHGTAMLPWDISEQQAYNVVQYIKTFAPDVWEGKDKKLGKKIEITNDPYGFARKESAIARGKIVYHIIAQCWTCHRSYASTEELDLMNRQINGAPFSDFDEEMYQLKIQESEHGIAVLPPDFTWHWVKSAKTVEELYLRLNAGVAGTTMVSWKDTLSDDDIWAVAHYVRSLMDLKGHENRDIMMKKLKLK
jgi:mono/diheme cytochrome c family protein